MDKVQWHLQRHLLAKNWLAKPRQPHEPPVAQCLLAHAELAATRGKGLLQSCCRAAAELPRPGRPLGRKLRVLC